MRRTLAAIAAAALVLLALLAAGSALAQKGPEITVTPPASVTPSPTAKPTVPIPRATATPVRAAAASPVPSTARTTPAAAATPLRPGQIAAPIPSTSIRAPSLNPATGDAVPLNPLLLAVAGAGLLLGGALLVYRGGRALF